MKELEKFRDNFYKKFRVPRKMIFGEEEQIIHNSLNECYSCGEKFLDDHPKGHKVRDHYHFTGKYKGALHNVWNVNVGAVPENEQHYIYFYKDKHFWEEAKDGRLLHRKVTCNFVDTLKHLACGLDSLVKGLPEGGDVCMRRYFGEENAKLLNRKGVYPYEHLDSLERFEETCLPPRERFDSYLKQGSIFEEGCKKNKIEPSVISDEEYAYVHKVWKELGCQNFGDYTETYRMADTLQLADVFEAYRKETMETFGIDPVYYPTLASVAQDAMLKHTGSEVELLWDENMYMFLEEGCRGGVSMACKRFCKANNKYLGEIYDPK